MVAPVRKGLVGRRIEKRSKLRPSASSTSRTWTIQSMSGEVLVASSAGRSAGISAPYRRAVSAISSESVETTTASNSPAS